MPFSPEKQERWRERFKMEELEITYNILELEDKNGICLEFFQAEGDGCKRKILNITNGFGFEITKPLARELIIELKEVFKI